MSPPNNNPLHVVAPAPQVEPANGHVTGVAVPVAQRSSLVWARLLWAKRAWLARAVVAGFVFFILVAIAIPVRYESKARLMPPDQSGSVAALAALAGRVGGGGGGGGLATSLGGDLGGVAGDLLGLKSSGALFVDMLQGPTIQDDVIKKFDLLKEYKVRYWQDARLLLSKHTEIKEDRKSGVISITVTDHDPQRAQQLAEGYVEALNGLVSQVSTSSARRERQFLEQRLKTVKQNLDAAAGQFSEYSSKSGTLDLPSQSRAMLESEATLEGQLVAAQSELEGFEQIYTDSNIRVRTLRGKIAGLKQQIEAMSGNKADLNADDSGIAGDLPSIRKLPLVGVEWANLYREAKIQETVYELLTQEYEFAKVQEAKEIPTVNVLDPPLFPEKKSFPPRTMIVIVGTFFSFFLASTAIIALETWRRSQSAEKEFATEIWAEIAAENSRPRVLAHQVWSKLGGNGRNGSSSRKSA